MKMIYLIIVNRCALGVEEAGAEAILYHAGYESLEQAYRRGSESHVPKNDILGYLEDSDLISDELGWSWKYPSLLLSVNP